MRFFTILAALLMTLILGTPVQAGHRYQHRHHHHGRSYGYSYPSVARHFSGGYSGYGYSPFGYSHPYYHGVSVAGPVHPLYGPGNYQPYGYGRWASPYLYGPYGYGGITIGGPRFGRFICWP